MIMKDHRRIDERSLAFGRAIAARLPGHPDLIAQARATLVRWMTTTSPGTMSELQAWLTALDGPLDGVIALLTRGDERAVRLRQSNPFTGVLSQRERMLIIKQFQAHDTAAT
jgi:hypothetical protein